MTKLKVNWSVLADSDLFEYVDYIALDNPDAANKAIWDIYDNVELLGITPLLGRVSDRMEGARELKLAKYPLNAVYRVCEDRVEILRLMHNARNWRGQR